MESQPTPPVHRACCPSHPPVHLSPLQRRSRRWVQNSQRPEKPTPHIQCLRNQHMFPSLGAVTTISAAPPTSVVALNVEITVSAKSQVASTKGCVAGSKYQVRRASVAVITRCAATAFTYPPANPLSQARPEVLPKRVVAARDKTALRAQWTALLRRLGIHSHPKPRFQNPLLRHRLTLPFC